MEDERRERLSQRRLQLKRDADHAARRESVRDLTDLLDGRRASYDVLFEDRQQVEWVWRHFPVAGGLTSPRIDWAAVRVCSRGPCASQGDGPAATWLAWLASSQGLGGCDVVLLPGNALNPALRFSFDHLVACPELVTRGFDSWIVCEAGGWAVEFLRFEYGRGWFWGRSAQG